MVASRKLSFLILGSGVLVVSCMCGLGAQSVGAPAPAPTVDLSQPSGGGSPPESTSVSVTAFPFVIQPTATALQPSAPVPVAPPPAILESRRLTLEYPPKIRTGDSDVVRLTLEIDTLGNLTPTAEVQGNLVTGQNVQIPNLYETHNVIAEARLDLAGTEVRPNEAISEPLLPGESVTFYWSVHPVQGGVYRGTAWLFLRFVDKASGAESRKAVAAQPVQIEATNFLGLSGNAARAAGGVGSVVGGVLGIPFVDEVLKWLWGRLKRRA